MLPADYRCKFKVSRICLYSAGTNWFAFAKSADQDQTAQKHAVLSLMNTSHYLVTCCCLNSLGIGIVCLSVLKWFNSLPNVKILDRSKLKAFAEDKINVTEILKFVLERVENIVGKGENAGYQHFLLFLQCFQKASYKGSLKVGIVW